jgi:putative exporter of polyketide antibiotics
MTATLVRRILYGAMAAWALVMAVEEFRLSGHIAYGIGLGVLGLLLVVMAATGKGG